MTALHEFLQSFSSYVVQLSKIFQFPQFSFSKESLLLVPDTNVHYKSTCIQWDTSPFDLQRQPTYYSFQDQLEIDKT